LRCDPNETLPSIVVRKVRTMKPTPKEPNWTPLPTEEDVRIQLTWTADARTRRAIERQAEKLGFDSSTDYLQRSIAAFIADDEGDTIVASDGRLLLGWDGYTGTTCHRMSDKESWTHKVKASGGVLVLPNGSRIRRDVMPEGRVSVFMRHDCEACQFESSLRKLLLLLRPGRSCLPLIVRHSYPAWQQCS